MEFFGEATFAEKIGLETHDLSAEEIARLIHQAEQGVGRDLGGAEQNLLRCKRASLQLAAHELRLAALLFPSRQTPLTEEIFVVQNQFFQAGAGDVRELDLGFLRSARSNAAFGDILDPAPRGLHHLVVRAGALLDETVAENHCGIENQTGSLKAPKPPVAAVLRENQMAGWRFSVHADALLPC